MEITILDSHATCIVDELAENKVFQYRVKQCWDVIALKGTGHLVIKYRGGGQQNLFK